MFVCEVVRIAHGGVLMSVGTLAVTKIKVNRPTFSIDAWGANKETFATHLRLNARVQPVSGREEFRYAREGEVISHVVYVSGAPDIKANDRIVLEATSTTLEVRSVRNIDQLDRFLTIACEQLESGA